MHLKWLPQNDTTGSFLDTIDENITDSRNWFQRVWGNLTASHRQKKVTPQSKRVYIEIGSDVVRNHINHS